eukprot:TRINITY_DN20517_c0_g1_i4.p1 TRINITY_DN20517_c0_g1~~TRINITY_DN20517_c0_g1_i4.p1  ORF type:complete len:294 (+),score=19.83 TRINITY_DN20517_c0_g1_i4:245-1126(+)
MLPILLCLGSGAIATFIAVFCPLRAYLVSIPGGVHEILALPLAILIAFRFDKSCERWWSSHATMQEIASDIVNLSMACRTPPNVSPTDRERYRANREHLFNLLESFCQLMEQRFYNPDCNPSTRAFSAPSNLEAKHVAACMEAEDAVVWCLEEIFACVHRGQVMDPPQFTGELASHMYAQVSALESGVRSCWMVVTQNSPGPFVVHLRTFLLFWCFTFPFTIIRAVPAATLMPLHMLISFAMLGIEFCSRELEHPFGLDDVDIDIFQVLEPVRKSIHQLHVSESRRDSEFQSK